MGISEHGDLGPVLTGEGQDGGRGITDKFGTPEIMFTILNAMVIHEIWGLQHLLQVFPVKMNLCDPLTKSFNACKRIRDIVQGWGPVVDVEMFHG